MFFQQNLDEYEKQSMLQLQKGGGIFKQKDKDNAIVQLMRINLLKRLESSIESFRLSTNRLLDNIDDVLDKIEVKA